jgi:transglutaminase-like putative cysteine protease
MYWRATAYDHVEPGAWRQRELIPVPVAADAPLLPANAADFVTPEGRQEVTFRVIPDGYTRSALLSPATPVSVNRPVELSVVGGAGFFASLQGDGASPYSITALVPVVGDDDDPDGLTANRLRVAGTSYPTDVRERFLEVTPDVAPDDGFAAALLEEIRTVADEPDNPYDLALAMQQYLRSSAFDYETNLSEIACDGLSVAECFARERVGFCQQYATTMAVLLRMAGIPSRYVSGFLPGQRTGDAERIAFGSAHAWVEAYFPGYGWVIFDPTGGGLSGQAEPLPPGEVIESPPPSTAPAPGASGPAPTRRPFDEPPGGPAVTGNGAPPVSTESAGLLIAVTLLLVVIVGGVAFVAWQRGPRGDLTPDRAYGALTRMAGRLGFAPRPTQTVYEYAGALGDVLPQSRPEIQTVAQAKVEVAYGRRALGADRMAALHDAQRRLRLGLLRLLFRRGPRNRRR